MAGPSGDNFQDFCTLYGSAIVTWTLAENAMALAIGIIDQNIPQLRNHSEIPMSLKNRLKYLRAALIDVPALNPVNDLGRKLTHDFPPVAKLRNELIHASFWQGADGGLQLMRFVIQGRTMTPREEHIDQAKLIFLHAEIAKLFENTSAFLLGVSEIFP